MDSIFSPCRAAQASTEKRWFTSVAVVITASDSSAPAALAVALTAYVQPSRRSSPSPSATVPW